MASSTPIRRPLATLNSNNVFSSQASRALSLANKSPKKTVFVEKALAPIAQEEEVTGKDQESGKLEGKKGHHTDDDDNVRGSKRKRITGPSNESSILEQKHEMKGTVEGNHKSGNEPQSEDNGASPVNLMSPSPENASSPSPSENSSLGSPIPIHDSQNTTITVPDEDLLNTWLTNTSSIATPPRPLTTEEVRQKAKEIKLRLSLANYKVRTNQIDVPISRLQIRSSMFPSRISRSHSPSQSHPPSRLSRTPLPSIPNIETSPRKYQLKSNDASNNGLSTPLLPRQREALLNPPVLDSPEERRLSSSAVKGHAVDGLLSLMRQHS